VVLVDEFDLHMHVIWQSEIIERLSSAFPNTQFVVTAHSPLVVQAADGKANIAVLRRVPLTDERKEVIIENNPSHVQGWRVDQLLMSDLFGLRSARTKTYEKLIQRKRELQQIEHLSADEAKELDELAERLSREAPPGMTPAKQWLEEQLMAATQIAIKKHGLPIVDDKK
jgi:predicted ATP-binding protein involved in virulence